MGIVTESGVLLVLLERVVVGSSSTICENSAANRQTLTLKDQVCSGTGVQALVYAQ
jgi:hypothetical protein